MNAVPNIGQVWPGQGGTYAGVARGRDGQPDHHLIVADKAAERLKWKAAIAWAAKVSVDGHTDFTLPDRFESSVLFGNVGELFERTWHWTSTQYDAGNAWLQDFGNGYQDYDDKSDEFAARAVRRLPIGPSVLSTEGAAEQVA